jgi:hypothetical protein
MQITRRGRLVDLVNAQAETVPLLYLLRPHSRAAPSCSLCVASFASRGLFRSGPTGRMSRADARLGEGEVRCLERGEPLARGGVQREMTDKTRCVALRPRR